MGTMDERVPGQTPDAQKLMQAIQTMLAGVGKATGATEGQPAMIPGQKPPTPGATIQFNPGGSPGGPIQARGPGAPPQQPRTGSESIGDFGSHGAAVNAGLVSLGNSLSGMFSTIEQKEHAKKAALAENYLTQINSLLTSGDPEDKKKAAMILEDPKIRKILKTGLEYVPLEEEVPPEAHGVQSAIKKIGQQGQGGGQPPPQKQPILPQASNEQQLKSAITNAMLQKVKQDPASALAMGGQSQLSGAEQHATEFYKAGLGISPAEMEKMTAAEKMNGLRIFEQATAAAMRAEVDMYRAKLGYESKVDSAKVFANVRKYVSDAAKSKTGSGKVNSLAAGAKIYGEYAKKYLDLSKSAKTPEEKKMYEQKADAYQKQADQYLNQQGDADLMEMFMKAIEEPDASTSDDDKPN